MANPKGSTNISSTIQNGKNAFLPPRIPFSTVSQSYTEFIPNSLVGSKSLQRPREDGPNHQRTASETLVLDEHPSWLDDLLDEPETPVRPPGHRRSSSDSFAYVEGSNGFNYDLLGQEEYNCKNTSQLSMWASPLRENNVGKMKNGAWNLSVNTTSSMCGPTEHVASSNSVPASPSPEPEFQSVSFSNRKNSVDASKPLPERKDVPLPNHIASENDAKRAKQQFAQRSRVRKLQYIAELERNVQALQAEGSEFSAELEFVNQQNLILTMENKTLKQRLESLAQEHLIKRLEYDVLEREIGRLKNVYQQQQQPPPSTTHRRSRSRDLDSQFASLSVKPKNSNSVSGPLRI